MQSHPIQIHSLIRSILFQRAGYKLLVLGVSLCAALVGLSAPYAQKQFIDGLLSGQPVLKWLMMAFALMASAQLAMGLALWLAMRESLITQKSLGDATYKRLLEGPGGLIGRRPAGEAVSLFAVDVPGAAALLAESLVMICGMLFPMLLAPIALKYLFGIPLAASASALAVMVGVNFILGKRQSKFFLKYKQLSAERTGLVAEWVQNIRTLRILGWVQAAESRIFGVRRRESRNRKAMLANGQFMNSIANSTSFALNILTVTFILSSRGVQPTPGELLSVFWILGVFLTRPIRQLPWMFVITMDSLSSLRRLQDALGLPIVRPEVANAWTTPKEVALEVKGLSLVSEDGQKLLSDVDFTVKRGEFVAIVGEVGSGKSLLLQSLMGATGAQFASYNLHGRSESFAFVPQEGFTMSATLRENVVFEYLAKSSDAHDREVASSLDSAQFIPERERIHDGLDTEIGERGVNLSGGQRQRIGLARAQYADRSVVLLDDCLSAVDVDTERRLIDELICGKWKDRARILVTHRMSVLPRCDRVVFMEEGSISMQGSFQQLLAGSQKFREFIRREAVKGAEPETNG